MNFNEKMLNCCHVGLPHWDIKCAILYWAITSATINMFCRIYSCYKTHYSISQPGSGRCQTSPPCAGPGESLWRRLYVSNSCCLFGVFRQIKMMKFWCVAITAECKHNVIHKPEVGNISPHRRRKTELRPQLATCKLDQVWICNHDLGWSN